MASITWQHAAVLTCSVSVSKRGVTFVVHTLFLTVGVTLSYRMDKHLIIKLIGYTFLYLILSCGFVLFYMLDQLNDFIEGRTTITSKIQKVAHLEFPTLVLCMNPGRKRSVGQKYGIINSDDIFFNYFPNITMDKVQEEFGYALNKDFTIKINGQGPLEMGQNNVKSFGDGNPLFQSTMETFTILSINTHFNGLCHKIEPHFQIERIPYSLNLSISMMDNSLLPMDQPINYDLYLISNKAYGGIIYQLWPQGSPTKTTINFDSGNTYLRFTSTKSTYIEGTDDSTKCFES